MPSGRHISAGAKSDDIVYPGAIFVPPIPVERAPFSYCGVGIKPFSVGVPCRIIVLSAVSVSRRNMASEALASGCQLRGRSDFR